MAASSMWALFCSPNALKNKSMSASFPAFATDPYWTSSLQIADDNPVVMPFADGDLINTDGSRRRQPRQVNLLLHVKLVQIFYRAVVQAFHLGDDLVRHIPAQFTHLHRKALRIAWILRQPVKVFYMHAITPWAVDTPAFELQIDAPPGDRQIPYPQDPFVVTSPTAVTTVRADSCFFRRLSWMTRAYRSPNTPTNFDVAVKPGRANSARIDLGFFIALT